MDETDPVGDVVVVTGPPGAGKSAVAASLSELFEPSALVAGDAFFAFLRRGAVAPWLPAAHEQNTAVIEAAAAATGRLAARLHVVYDGIVGPWFLAAFHQSSGLSHLHYVVLLPPLATCLERVQSRAGHAFTDAGAAEHMWHEFEGSDIDPRHVVRDHDRGPSELARALASRMQDGAFRRP